MALIIINASYYFLVKLYNLFSGFFDEYKAELNWMMNIKLIFFVTLQMSLLSLSPWSYLPQTFKR